MREIQIELIPCDSESQIHQEPIKKILSVFKMMDL